MTHSFMILLQDSFMLTAIMSLFASFAVVGSVLSGTDAEDASEGELDDDSQFQFSAAALRQYQEMVAETDARIAELADQLDDDSCTDRAMLFAKCGARPGRRRIRARVRLLRRRVRAV